MIFLTNDTLHNLSKRLNLAFDGSQQDWAIEFADSPRISGFIEFASNSDLTNEEAYGIMSLILASYDDYLSDFGEDKLDYWNRIIDLLNRNIGLYKDLLNYWALWSKNEDFFNITKQVRKYLSVSPDVPSRT